MSSSSEIEKSFVERTKSVISIVSKRIKAMPDDATPEDRDLFILELQELKESIDALASLRE